MVCCGFHLLLNEYFVQIEGMTELILAIDHPDCVPGNVGKYDSDMFSVFGHDYLVI
jgi:hypothetical protein